MIAVGPYIGFNSLSTGTSSTTSFFLLGGARINFTQPFEQAIYFAPALGLSFATGGTSFVFELAFGKRFPIAHYLTYSPQFSLYKVGSSSLRFKLQLINFSYSL